MIIKCKMCGGDIQFNPGDTCGQCDHCGCTSTLPKLPDDQRTNLFNRANHFRRQCEFDKAMAAYEHILEADDTDAEAHWGVVLSKFGIEYVEDPVTHERIPTCHRAQVVSILSDEDYQNAIKYAPDTQSREIYEQEAKRIAEIQKGILAISSQEKPYDVFICYKETDDSGSRTKDSTIAQEIYYQLTNEGYKVFFSRITLEDKLGQEYEPYIFAALNSAKVMLVVGTEPENFSAVWVKNEWSRFLAIMKNDRKRVLIPCYRDMDPYDLPEELSSLQSQDMSKIGFVQDLIHGVKKVLGSDKQSVPNVTVQSAGPGVASLHKRAVLFLEDSDWDSATEYFDRILDIDPEYAPAYIGKVQVKNKVRREIDLARCPKPLSENADFQKALRFADERQKDIYNGYNRSILDRIALEQKEANYQEAAALESRAAVETDFLAAARKFDAAEDIRDAKQRAANCRAKAATAKAEAEKAAAVYKEQMEKERKERERQEEQRRIEEENRRKEEKERREKEEKLKQEKKKRTHKILALVAAIVLVLIVGYFAYDKIIVPKNKYSQAQKLLDEGKLDEAFTAFSEMNGYEDSAEKIKEIHYKKAEGFLQTGKLADAKDSYVRAGDYQDSAQIIGKIEMYETAESEYAKGNYASAGKTYKQLGDFLDATEKYNNISSSLYEQANHALENKDYAKAYELLSILEDYSDSKEKMAAIDQKYETAIEYWKKGEKTTAEKELQGLSGWKDTDSQMAALRLEMAEDAYVAEDYDTALRYYAMLERTEDIETKIQTTEKAKAYTEARTALAAGKHEEALDKYRAAGDYSDATEQAGLLEKYLQAVENQNAENYTGAREIYLQLGNYLDAGARLENCNEMLYQQAATLKKDGDISAAYFGFSAIRDYSDSREIISRIEENYNKAKKLLDEGKFDEAYTAFKELKNYEDSEIKAKESLYKKAGALAAEKQYDEAINLYTSIEDYTDSKEKAKLARYDKAKALWDSGDLKEAMKELEALGDYGDAKEQLKKLSTDIADQAMNEKDYATALNAYQHMEQTDEIKTKEYTLAQTCYDDGYYAEATAAYELLGQYELSLSKLPIARYAWANQLFQNGEYEKAAEQFALLGDMTDSSERATESKYQQASQLFQQGEYDQAKAIYAEISGYQDADNQTKECDYQIACEMLDNGKIQEAQQLFASLDGYSDSLNKVQQCIYIQAEGLLEKENYTAAKELYQSITYQDSEEKAKLSAYQEASKYYENQQYAEAETVFLALGGYSDCEEKVKDCHLQQGKVLMEKGDYQGALSFFETVDYGNSADMAARCHYELGRAAHVSGDVDAAVIQYAYALSMPEAREVLMSTAKEYASINEIRKAIQTLWLIRDQEEAQKTLNEIGDLKVQTSEKEFGLLAYLAAGTTDTEQVTGLINEVSYDQIQETVDGCDLLPPNLTFSQDIVYQYALALRNVKKYEEAIEAFETLSTYSDAETQIKETRYLQATSLTKDGDYIAAIDIYSRIFGYKDVDSIIENDENLAEALATTVATLEAKLELYKTIGAYVTFGTYPQTSKGMDQTPIEWLVLDYDETNNKVLLLSKYGLDAKPYNEDFTEITWEKSSLRTWLNEEFLTKAFNVEEQSAILTSIVDNSPSQCYGEWYTDGENSTQDQIFLLSYAEANKYLGVTYGNNNNLQSRVSPTEYAIAQGVYTSKNNQTEEGKEAAWWWLRSPGDSQGFACNVFNDGSLQYVFVNYDDLAIRPAIWLNLESDIFITAYEALADYSISTSRIKERKYKAAIELQIAGQYEEAITAFEALDDYNDAETQIKETKYLQATSLANSGDYTAAYAVYSQISGYKDVDSIIENDENLEAIRASAHEEKMKPYKTIGTYVAFGTYPQTSEGTDQTPIEWLVLDYDETNNKVLLLSRYSLDVKPYNTELTDITWEKCSLRTWLNKDFLRKAFSNEEQTAILITTVDNSSSQGYNGWNMDGGNRTQDKVFLLSYKEANMYLNAYYGNDNNLQSRAAPTKYAIAQGVYVTGDNKTEDGKVAGWWLLRSPGNILSSVIYVDRKGSLNNCGVNSDRIAVRPALWLNLESDIF